MTSSNGIIFRVTGPSWRETIGHRWIPLTKASDAELWCFLWSAPEQTVVLTIEMPVIWDAIALIMTSLLCDPQWRLRLSSGHISLSLPTPTGTSWQTIWGHRTPVVKMTLCDPGRYCDCPRSMLSPRQLSQRDVHAYLYLHALYQHRAGAPSVGCWWWVTRYERKPPTHFRGENKWEARIREIKKKGSFLQA